MKISNFLFVFIIIFFTGCVQYTIEIPKNNNIFLKKEDYKLNNMNFNLLYEISKNNKNIENKQLDIKLLETNYEIEKKSLNIILSSSISKDYQPLTNIENSQINLSLKYPIDYLKENNLLKKEMKLKEIILKEEIEQLHKEKFIKLYSYYLDYITLNKKEEIIKNLIIETNKIHYIVKERYKINLENFSNLLTIENILEEYNKNINLIQKQKATIKKVVLILYPEMINFNWETIEKEFMAINTIPTKIYQRSDLRISYYQMLLSDIDITKAINKQYPQLNLNFGVNNHDNWELQFDNWIKSIILSLSAPIWDQSIQSNIQKTNINLEKIINNYEIKIDNIVISLEENYYKYFEINKNINLLNNTIERQIKVYELKKKQYMNNKITYFELFNTFRTLQNLYLENINLKKNKLITEINLLIETGNL